MGFQPDLIDGLFYPSAAPPLGNKLFAPAKLVESPPGSHLFAFDIGDYAYPVLEPSPHVELTIFEFADGCATISVFRTVGRRTMPVRGMQRVPAAGGVNVVDWEAPAGVLSTYFAAQYDSDGNFLANTRASSTQLDFDGTWVHNPLDPASAMRVALGRGSAAKVTRSHEVATDWAEGSALPVVISGQRRGTVESPLVLYTLTDADSDAFSDLLGDPYEAPSGPPVLCIRPGSRENTRWPQPFIAVVELDEQPVSHPALGEITRWEGTATETEPPAISLVGAVLTYDDLDASYPSSDAMDAAYSSYLARDRDYRLAGAADGAAA